MTTPKEQSSRVEEIKRAIKGLDSRDALILNTYVVLSQWRNEHPAKHSSCHLITDDDDEKNRMLSVTAAVDVLFKEHGDTSAFIANLMSSYELEQSGQHDTMRLLISFAICGEIPPDEIAGALKLGTSNPVFESLLIFGLWPVLYVLKRQTSAALLRIPKYVAAQREFPQKHLISLLRAGVRSCAELKLADASESLLEKGDLMSELSDCSIALIKRYMCMLNADNTIGGRECLGSSCGALSRDKRDKKHDGSSNSKYDNAHSTCDMSKGYKAIARALKTDGEYMIGCTLDFVKYCVEIWGELQKCSKKLTPGLLLIKTVDSNGLPENLEKLHYLVGKFEFKTQDYIDMIYHTVGSKETFDPIGFLDELVDLQKESYDKTILLHQMIKQHGKLETDFVMHYAMSKIYPPRTDYDLLSVEGFCAVAGYTGSPTLKVNRDSFRMYRRWIEKYHYQSRVRISPSD